MNKIALILLTIVCLFGFGCERKTIISDISNSITDKHINVPKTRLFLIPPRGFLTDKSTSALWMDSTGVIQVIDLVDVDYESCILNLGKKGFEERGIKVISSNELKVGGYSGRISVVDGYNSSNTNMQSYYLVFGDSSFCSVVVGSYLRENKETAEQILESLKTICYDKSINVPAPFESMCFKLDDSKSILRFVTYTGSLFIYSKNGENSAEAYPILTISTIPRNMFSIKKNAENLFQQMNKTGVKILKNEYEKIGKTNGFESFQSECQVQINNMDYSLFIHIVIIDNNIIVMQGFADRYNLQSMEEIKNLTNTISRK